MMSEGVCGCVWCGGETNCTLATCSIAVGI